MYNKKNDQINVIHIINKQKNDKNSELCYKVMLLKLNKPLPYQFIAQAVKKAHESVLKITKEVNLNFVQIAQLKIKFLILKSLSNVRNTITITKTTAMFIIILYKS